MLFLSKNNFEKKEIAVESNILRILHLWDSLFVNNACIKQCSRDMVWIIAQLLGSTFDGQHLTLLGDVCNPNRLIIPSLLGARVCPASLCLLDSKVETNVEFQFAKYMLHMYLLTCRVRIDKVLYKVCTCVNVCMYIYIYTYM